MTSGIGSATATTQRVVLSNDYESTNKAQIENDSTTISDANPLQIKIQEIDSGLSNKVPTNLFVNNTAVSVNDGLLDNGTIRVIHANDASVNTVIQSSVTLTVLANQYNDSGQVTDANPLQSSLYTNGSEISYNDGVVDANTIRVVHANDVPITVNAGTNLNTSALALESGGNLESIATNVLSLLTTTNFMRIDVGTIDTSVGSIDGKTPALGQTTESGSVPVVLSSDYLSTVTKRDYIEENLEYDNALFHLAGSENLAQNVAAGTNSTLPDFPGSGIVYVDKINMKLQIDGAADADAWGSTNDPLNNGWVLKYLKNSSSTARFLTPQGKPMLSHADLRFFGDDSVYHSFGAGEDAFLAEVKYSPKLKIDLDDGGYIRIEFGIDDYSQGNVLQWYTSVGYYRP